MSTIKLEISAANQNKVILTGVDLDCDDTLQDAVEREFSFEEFTDEQQAEILEALEDGDYIILASDGLVGSFVNAGILDDAFFECRDHDLDEAVKQAWLDNGMEWDADQINEAYQGRFNSDADFARDLCDQIRAIPDDFPSWISIDWYQTAKDIMMDYFESNGHYFRNL
jgi:antirestriction protein